MRLFPSPGTPDLCKYKELGISGGSHSGFRINAKFNECP